jgi:D-alanyl-D-alanine dipeptidase
MNRLRLGLSLALGSALFACASAKPARGTVPERPGTFVSLSELDPTILIELRYFGTHNFMGKRVLG